MADIELVIQIPDSIYETIKEEEVGNVVYKVIKNGTPLPENPTNGDMIKAIFPNVRLDDGGEWRHIFWGVQAKASFSQDWWNAPYKAESEEQA